MEPSELEREQAYIDRAYACLERTRAHVTAGLDVYATDAGGTFQARHEREIATEVAAQRLAQLDLGDQSLCFGRIDLERDNERHYIGRVAVSDANADSVVVDWRAPVAEAFYRATGREPMGLLRRRHFSSQGHQLRGIDDELFGEARDQLAHGRLQGEGALIAALEQARSGRLSDIVATIQGEQDEVIRSPMQGVLVVQGGPGTGKTVVALHRAAYLLYTHRFPLEGQGVLVLGPNRLFLSYIEQVLPSLGEAGVEIAMLADLIPHVRINSIDTPEVAQIKGRIEMIQVIRKAVRDRQRALRTTVEIPYGTQILRISPHESRELVAYAKRRAHRHNQGRKHLQIAFYDLLVTKLREPLDATLLRDRIRHLPSVREALERMWPVLSPAQLLHDLFGSRALLRLAGSKYFRDDELELLLRSRCEDLAQVVWTTADVPLLDEALEVLGPRPRHAGEDVIRTYGHIVIDEAQDLSPMELRVAHRRSLNGSMTVVGDIAQGTGPFAYSSWDAVCEHLPNRHPSRYVELAVGYRVPGPIMALASRVLRIAAPGLAPPTSVRAQGDEPILQACADHEFDAELCRAVQRELHTVGPGSVGVICPSSWVSRVEQALDRAGIDFGRSARGRLDHQLSVVAVSMCKGLELDSVIVVEPSIILDQQHRGAQALYVALTRATKRMSVLATSELPALLA